MLEWLVCRPLDLSCPFGDRHPPLPLSSTATPSRFFAASRWSTARSSLGRVEWRRSSWSRRTRRRGLAWISTSPAGPRTTCVSPSFSGSTSSLSPSLAQQTAEFLLRAKEDLEAIVRLMRTGDAPATSSFASTNPTPALPAPPTRNTPSHLQDLVAEDLPDASRGIITSEIALFRERAAQRAKEQKEQDLAAEMRRHAPQSDMSRAPQQQGNAWGSRGGQQDPQSYNKPIGFVGAGTAVGAAKEADARPSPPPVDEALQERERAQRAQREAEALFRDVRCSALFVPPRWC